MQWDESHETEESTDTCDIGLNLCSSDCLNSCMASKYLIEGSCNLIMPAGIFP